MASTTTDERRIWQSGGLRRITLAFAFLILLPFWASLGPMLVQRATRGFVGDTIALGVLAIAFTLLMALLLQQLIHAVRTRIVVDDKSVALTVPAVGKRGPLFFLNYVSKTVPFSDIGAIDRRNEVYGGTLAPVLLTSTRISLKQGDPIVLGYTNTNEQDDQFPYPEIADLIATRAGVQVVDHGTVHRSVQGRVLGLAATPAQPLSAAELDVINAGHRRNVRGLVAALALLVVAGITIDFATASRTTYAEMGAGLANPTKGAPPVPKKK